MRLGISTLFLFIMGLLIGSLFIYGGFTMKLNGEKIDCYDRLSNKIQGEVCIVEGQFDTRKGSVIMTSIIGIMVVIVLTMLGSLMDKISRPWGGGSTI